MQRLKGFTVQQLTPIAITFVVAIFAITMGANILTDLATNQCESAGYTWEHDACWSTYNATDGCPTGSNCAEFGNYAINVSVDGGLESLETFGEWTPTLALVIIAAVIIGVLVFYLGRAGR